MVRVTGTVNCSGGRRPSHVKVRVTGQLAPAWPRGGAGGARGTIQVSAEPPGRTYYMNYYYCPDPGRATVTVR